MCVEENYENFAENIYTLCLRQFFAAKFSYIFNYTVTFIYLTIVALIALLLRLPITSALK